jgi:hypothetical protein
MAEKFSISEGVESLTIAWAECNDSMRDSRGEWNDGVADYFMREYWSPFERTVPNMISYFINLNDYLNQIDQDI